MSMLDATRFVERLRFFDGQRLFAADLEALEGFHRELRWLHNRSLHQPGIGSGYAVYGATGDREVRIGPGYAIDACGREIVLTEERVESVPPDAGTDGDKPSPTYYDLTVSYPVDEDLQEAETRAGICRPRGVVRLREEPVFCWVQLVGEKPDLVAPQPYRDEISQGCKIVIARAEILNCKLNQPLSVSQRLSARPPQRPYIACGSGQPQWDMANQLGPPQLNIGLVASINTTEAGFRSVPCYSARIDGKRQIGTTLLFDVFTAIDNSQKDAFEFHLLVLAVDTTKTPQFSVPGVAEIQNAGWRVEWMGVED
jgi:hypothetical protein